MSNKLKDIQDKITNKKSTAHAELLHQYENTEMNKYENNKKNKNENKKRATFELDEDLHTELKIFATKNKTKMVNVVVDAVRKYMREFK